MATESKVSTAIVPLNGSNYPTWKIQCKMALMKEGVWGIVTKKEVAPRDVTSRDYQNFMTKYEKALAIIVLTLDPSLLYLIGEPDDPVAVWEKLAGQFQKKTWANKLALRRKLYSLRLKDGDSVHEHIKSMTEIFNELSVIGVDMGEEDRVVHLLASLPESYSTLVTALEARPDVPTMEVVVEKLLYEDSKLKDRQPEKDPKGFSVRHRSRGPKCHFCHKFGHIQRNCSEKIQSDRKSEEKKVEKRPVKHRAHQTQTRRKDSEDSDSNTATVGLVTRHILSVNTSGESADAWIVDSGATCHISNCRESFTSYEMLKKPLEVSLGDGYMLEAMGTGVVSLMLELPDKQLQCNLYNVLHVPKLTYNLLSVSKMTDNGKHITFSDDEGHVYNEEEKLIAIATKKGNLYHLNCRQIEQRQAYIVKNGEGESKEIVWHKRYGHLGEKGLRELVKYNLVFGFDYNLCNSIDFCKSCVVGRRPFTTTGRKRADTVLGLVHSDVCGKISTPSLGGAEYFLTFIDDRSHYIWVYMVRRKSEVLKKFIEWKALVEKSSGHKVQTLRTDNGGEYCSNEFETYCKQEGIRHEFTIPKTPQQNGVAERMNRTLVETVRAMLDDSQLTRKFWAEALASAVYLRNRSPTTAVSGMTPYEAWTGEKPDVAHLRTFGCTAYVHIPKDERDKLDAKARKCILLGYGTETKGYRLYDPVKLRVIHSRDVIFNEFTRGIETANKENSPLVSLETNDDEKTDSDQPESIADDIPVEQEIRRSTRQRNHPDRYGIWANTVTTEPATVNEAMSGSEKKQWKDAMKQEMDSIYSNDVWDLVSLPEGRKVVGNKWVFKKKLRADGTIERFKARLVAQGFSQQHGYDYDETFSPVIRFESVRTLIALAAQQGLKLHQMDVTAAFLNGKLDEEVYMKQPEGFVIQGKEELVCKLKHSIYGLKQSPRCWNATLDQQLREMGLSQSTSDPCIYTSTSEGEFFIVGVYVDDIILAGRSDERMSRIKKALSEKFKLKDLGEMNHFLGVKVVQDPKEEVIWIGQPLYTDSILEKFGMSDAKPISTPVAVNTKLMLGTEDSEYFDKPTYQSAVGCLLYLATKTRPDITFAVSQVARFTSNPTQQHWTAVKRIFRYLKGTSHYGLVYRKGDSTKIYGYSDADWGGDCNDFKSTSGYIFQMSGTAVSWRTNKQTCVALSTAEAEYMALASAAQEAVWMRQLSLDMQLDISEPTIIFEDNQAAICMSRNPQFHGRTKHIGIKYHYVREQVSKSTIELRYCRTDNMIADIFTKGLSQEKFIKLRSMCGIYQLYKQ